MSKAFVCAAGLQQGHLENGATAKKNNSKTFARFLMSEKKTFNRRSVIEAGVRVPLAAVVAGALTACGKQGEDFPVCADLDSLSLGEQGSRRAINYVEVSGFADKNCSNCAYFSPEPVGADGAIADCGTCSIFQGPANKRGHCDSWSIKDSDGG